MTYRDLRDFMAGLEKRRRAVRVGEPVSARLEMTAVSDFVLRQGGPALLFENPAGYKIPVLANLFGTGGRVARGMGAADVSELRDIGELLANLKEPEPPKGVRDAGRLLQLAKALWSMRPATVARAPCREVVLDADEVDLGLLPVQTCWPGDAGPLITWGLVITRGPQGGPAARKRQNLGIYRQQVIGRRQVIMRWLAHRGGALDFREFAASAPGSRSRSPSPSAPTRPRSSAPSRRCRTASPNTSSPACSAAARTEVSDCSVGDAGVMLQAPASAEFVLEGHIPPAPPGFSGASEHGVPLKEIGGYLHALEGPFGDHTGYYNEADWFPVFEIARLTHRAVADLPLHLHRQAAGRAGGAGRRPERGIRADPAGSSFRRSSTSTCRPRAAATGWRSSRSPSAIRVTPSG